MPLESANPGRRSLLFIALAISSSQGRGQREQQRDHDADQRSDRVGHQVPVVGDPARNALLEGLDHRRHRKRTDRRQPPAARSEQEEKLLEAHKVRLRFESFYQPARTHRDLVEMQHYWDTAVKALTGRELILIDADKVKTQRNLMLFDPEVFRVPPPMIQQRFLPPKDFLPKDHGP